MGLRQDIILQPISELSIREAITLGPEATVRECADQMRRHKLGCVVVVDSEGKPVGKFTERLLMKFLVDHSHSLDEPVKGFMYQESNSMKESDTIARLLARMRTKMLRFVPVVDDAGKVIGLTGQKGLIEYIAEHFPRQVKTRELKSKLFMDQREGA